MRPLLKSASSLLLEISCLIPLNLQAQTPTVVKLTIHDTIQPITADYLERGLQEAARQRAQPRTDGPSMRAIR